MITPTRQKYELNEKGELKRRRVTRIHKPSNINKNLSLVRKEIEFPQLFQVHNPKCGKKIPGLLTAQTTKSGEKSNKHIPKNNTTKQCKQENKHAPPMKANKQYQMNAS